jgi:uncharacterized membrane protein (UPF0127 family)
MFKSIFLPLIAVAAFITFIGLFSQGKLDNLNSNESSAYGFKTLKIGDTEINVEVARTNFERSNGLSNRESLGEKNGMIFVFDRGSKPTFWMKDTKIALDLIWIRDNGIIKIDKNVQPELGKRDSELTKYPAPSGIDYVLEVNGGFSDKFKVSSGQMLSGLEQL